MNDEKLQAIRDRCENATDGPWEEWKSDIGPHYDVILFHDSESMDICSSLYRADAEFIAHAREDVPALLAEIERLQAQNGIMREALDNLANDESWIDRPSMAFVSNGDSRETAYKKYAMSPDIYARNIIRKVEEMK